MTYDDQYPFCVTSRHSVVELSFSNIDEQASELSGYNQNYQQFGSGRFQGKFLTCEYDDEFSIFVETVNRKLFQKFRVPKDKYAICVMMGSNDETLINGIPFSHHQAMIFAPDSEVIVSTSETMKVCVLSVSRSLFEKHILFETIPSLKDMSMDTALIYDANPHSATHLLSSIQSSLNHMAQYASRDSDKYSYYVREHKIALIASIFSMFSNADTLRIIRQSDKIMRQRNIFQSIKHTLDMDCVDLHTISDLCENHNVSRRVTEQLFQSFIALSPAKYAKVTRLNQIRRDLQSSQYKDVPIGDIAANWGVWHLGHLARDYRNLFDELPSETRKRLSTEYIGRS